MAPRKAKRHLNQPSVAEPTVAKDTCHKSSRHVGLSQVRSTVSEEEFDLHEVEDDAETSDVSASPEIEDQDTRPQQAGTLNMPTGSKKGLAYDLMHFFDNFNLNPNPDGRNNKAKADEGLPDRICSLCAYVRTF